MNKIAKAIDHTDIRKEATAKDIKERCNEAKKYGFHGVVVNPKFVSVVSKELEGTEIKTVVLIDPPMGLSSHTERLKACRKAKREGADELDIVLNVIDVKYDRYDKVLKDLKALCSILPTKVIIGSGFLTDDEIVKVSKVVKKAGAFCIKTATEKDPLEHRELKEKVHHLKLMKEHASPLKVKASGNIRTLQDIKKVLRVGVDFVGTSSGIQIMKDLGKKS